MALASLPISSPACGRRLLVSTSRPRETPCDVSWNVMRCHVPGRDPPGLPSAASSASVFLPAPVSFRSRRRRHACGASLFRAYRMCARARVRAGAVRAPDCARANQAQGARLLSVPLGFFCAGARRETKQPPDAASFCLILPLISENQVLIQDLFLYCANLSGRIATRASSAMPSPSPAPAAPGKAQPPKAEDVSRHIAIMKCHVTAQDVGRRGVGAWGSFRRIGFRR